MIYIRLLWTFVQLSIINELAYRANFFVQLLQSLLTLGAVLAGLAIVFAHTGNLGSWGPNELLALLGVYMLVGGAINLALQPSMQRLINAVQDGTLDFILTKPADAQALVSMQRVQIWELIDVVQGVIVLTVALTRMNGHAGSVRIGQALMFALALLAGGAIIYSFWLALATCSFWLVRVESLLAIFQSMYQAGRWPLSIYPLGLRLLLTFIIPVGLATSIPAAALNGRLTWATLAGLIALAVGMLIAARRFWLLGLRRYSGASA